MSRPRRPVPITMRVADLGSDFLFVHCPNCGRSRQMTDRHLEREYPGDTLLIKVVAKHFCRQCSTGDRKVWGIGQIHEYWRTDPNEKRGE